MTRFHHDNQETSCNKFAGGEIPAHTRAGSLSDEDCKAARPPNKSTACMHTDMQMRGGCA